MKDEINQLFKAEHENLKKLHQIIEQTIDDEKKIINDLLSPVQEQLTVGQKISDKVATFGGSWNFIILFGVILFLWICFNVIAIKQLQFDPFPFILMNLILSCIAALQAPIIMMSQNRQEEKDRIRSENDYLINLKSEMQIRSLHQKIDLLLEKQMDTLYKTQEKQFELLQKIYQKCDKDSQK
ncbi:MAG: DUF1003 domain-containing protein [Bacteroidetes bacterium]|nr:MAG: DUF1003 domain-containing protein [Bacteroidota bacterium]